MKNIFIIATLSFILTGCAATSPQVVTTTPLPLPYQQGVYHEVLRGQTLWRIAKAYDVDIKDIAEINRISDPSRIDTGQMVFIPGAKKPITGELRQPSAKSAKGYIWPVKGRVVSYYGSRRENVTNKGIDIEAAAGTTIVAARSGKVVFCDEQVKGLGKTIIIDHGNGYSTLYAHNSVNLVECNSKVDQNQPIARIGETGRADKPTLHFQIRKGHEPQNPFYYLP